MCRMKREILGLVLLMGVALCAAPVIQACSEDSNAIVLSGASAAPAGFTAADMKAASGNGCEGGAGGCDGVIPDFPAFSMSVVDGGTEAGITLSLDIDDLSNGAGTDESWTWTNPGIVSVPGDVETDFINEINGIGSANVTGGVSALVSADAGSIILTALSATADLAVTGAGTGTWANTTPADATTSDLDAFFGIIDLIEGPSEQDIVDAAVANGDIDSADDTERTGTIVNETTVACDSGEIRIITTLTGTIDANEMLISPIPFFRDQYVFLDCRLEGDLASVGGIQSITFNGTVTNTETQEDDTDAGTQTDIDTLTTGSGLTIATDADTTDGDITPFWVDLLDIDLRVKEVFGMAPSMEVDGGFCFGGQVSLGDGGPNDDTTDADDDCDTNGVWFVKASDLP